MFPVLCSIKNSTLRSPFPSIALNAFIACFCISLISFIMSLLLACPLFIMKFACFVEIYASFTLYPFRFNFWSIKAPALISFGFLNTLPAFGYSSGWFFILFSVYSLILSFICFLFNF